MQDLSPDLAVAGRAIAARLREAGHRVWIVGGATRDLALGLGPHEIDVASAAEPDVVQSTFPRTTPLGRAFGTVIIHIGGANVEHTTFRTEAGYSDGRRPDEVRFGATVEEDATRRDFTCNAIYLDPQTGEVRDPVGGLDDLEHRRLDCVGDAGERFREDALRPLRMARFAGILQLEPTARTEAAARAEAGGLARVSRERVLRELEALFSRAGSDRGVRWMERCALLEPALPGYEHLGALDTRLLALEALPAAPGIERGLAVLLGPPPEALEATWIDRSSALVEGLRTSRHLRNLVEDAWRLAAEMRAQQNPARSARVRWMRRASFPVALAWTEAWAVARGESDARWRALAEERTGYGPLDLEPERLLDPADLAEIGIHPGPRLGEILRALEIEQLDGRLRTREDALAWLSRLR